MANIKSKTILPRLALLLAAVIWGGSFVVLKNALDSLPIFWLFSIRFIFSALILAAVFFRHLKNINKRSILGAIPIGVCLFVAYTLQTYGLVYTEPGINAFLTDAYCVLTPFLYWLIGRKRPDRFNVIASVICLVGIGLISVNSDLSVGRGELLTIACSLFFGLHLVFVYIFGKDNDPIIMTIFQFAVAGLLSVPFAAALEPIPKITSDSLFQMGYLVLLATAAAMLLQNVGQKFTPPAQSAILLSLESVLGVVFSIIFYGERPLAKTYVGFALIFTAIVVSETKLEFLKRRRQ